MAAMSRPTADLALVQGATRRLLDDVAGLTEGDLRRPSLLEGWEVAHVLTHLARNADSHVRRLEAARRGEAVPPYEGGRAARDAAIAEGARRPARDVLFDLRAACERLEGVLSSLPEPVWDGAVLDGDQRLARASTLPFARAVEVEVHHVDLDLGYEPPDWPQAFVDRALPETLERLARRFAATGGGASSWHLHRTDGPGEWTVSRSPEGTTVSTGHVRADAAARGPGWALLAWMLGRFSAAALGLELHGDTELAAALPATFPYG